MRSLLPTFPLSPHLLHDSQADSNSVLRTLIQAPDLTRAGFTRLLAPAFAALLLPQVQLHVAARLAWSKALAAAHRLDFDGAIPHAHTAARSARAFRDLATHTEKLLLLRCVATTGPHRPTS